MPPCRERPRPSARSMCLAHAGSAAHSNSTLSRRAVSWAWHTIRVGARWRRCRFFCRRPCSSVDTPKAGGYRLLSKSSRQSSHRARSTLALEKRSALPVV
jgi:hypothetical protein